MRARKIVSICLFIGGFYVLITLALHVLRPEELQKIHGSLQSFACERHLRGDVFEIGIVTSEGLHEFSGTGYSCSLLGSLNERLGQNIEISSANAKTEIRSLSVGGEELITENMSNIAGLAGLFVISATMFFLAFAFWNAKKW